MINNTNRIKVAREAVKHIYIAELMMLRICHNTDCGGCPFYNVDVPSGESPCFYDHLGDIRAKFPKLENMLVELDDQPKHSKPIEEVVNETSR